MKKAILTLIIGLACMTNAKAGDWSISIGIPGLLHIGNHHHHVVTHCSPPVVYHAPQVIYTPPPVVYHAPPTYHVHSTGAVTYTVVNPHGHHINVRAPSHVRQSIVTTTTHVNKGERKRRRKD